MRADERGRLFGKVRFNVELWILEKYGLDPEPNPYALNETLRILFRTRVSFCIMIVVSLITGPDPKDVLDESQDASGFVQFSRAMVNMAASLISTMRS